MDRSITGSNDCQSERLNQTERSISRKYRQSYNKMD